MPIASRPRSSSTRRRSSACIVASSTTLLLLLLLPRSSTNDYLTQSINNSDFVWLHTQLSNHHRGIIIPPLPEKSLGSSKYSLGAGSRFSEALLEYRSRELERFVRRVTSHPVLCTSKYLQHFLESEESAELQGLKPLEEDPAKATSTSSSSGSGFFGMLGRGIGITGPAPATEVDQWFDLKANYLLGLQNELQAVSRGSATVISKHAGMLAAAPHEAGALLQCC